MSSSSSFSRRRFMAAVVSPLAAACGVSLSSHPSAKGLAGSGVTSTTLHAASPSASGWPRGPRRQTMVYDDKGGVALTTS